LIARVLPHEVADGATLMAGDEALLDSVAGGAPAAVRTYEWSPPTLSLGYFQRLDEARADPRFADAPIVRRPTGGGAIWHDREITYAVVLPSADPLADRASDLYGRINRLLCGILRDAGIDARRRGGDRDPTAPRPMLCFLDRDPEDVVCRGHKVVGAAQRRRRGAVLQHGSILLGQSPTLPELPGLADLAPMPEGLRSPAGWVPGLAARLAQGLLPGVVQGRWSAEELDARRRLRGAYRGEDWTDRA